jgi:hypothetical protein
MAVTQDLELPIGSRKSQRMMGDWRTFDTFVPPSERYSSGPKIWYWIAWDKAVYLCRYEKPGIFIPVDGGVVLGATPKYWMPLDIPPSPLPSYVEGKE